MTIVRQRVPCVGCNKDTAVTPVTGVVLNDGTAATMCSICQANNRMDPVAEADALNRDLQRFGVKPDAPVEDEKPFGAWQTGGNGE